MLQIVPPKSVFFLTMSVEEDLLFTANPLIETLVLSALARALHHFPITICAYLFNATHFHLIVCVDDPEHLRGFKERMKTESAHYINRILGRKKRTVWCEGCDNPVLLDPEIVIQKLIYLYTNPAKDNLEESIEKFPGVNSWTHFCSGREAIEVSTVWIKRSDLTPLPPEELTNRRYQTLRNSLKAGKKPLSFTVHPDAWMDYFSISNQKERRVCRTKIFEGVARYEQILKTVRQQEGKKVLGAHKLKNCRPGTPYRPSSRSGRKSFCLSTDKERRRDFIQVIKIFIEQAKEVFSCWKKGDISIPYPLWLYPPPKPRLVYPLSW